MDLTNRLVEEQEFPYVLRGYDTAAVDEFLARVGRGVHLLRERLGTLESRVAEFDQYAVILQDPPQRLDPATLPLKPPAKSLAELVASRCPENQSRICMGEGHVGGHVVDRGPM